MMRRKSTINKRNPFGCLIVMGFTFVVDVAGATGATGPAGLPGPPGPQGATGIRGLPGIINKDHYHCHHNCHHGHQTTINHNT